MRARVTAAAIVAFAASMMPILATNAGAQNTATNCPSTVEQVAVKQKVADKVLARAHIKAKAARKYTIGFAVPPSLGGSPKIANLTAVLRTDQAARDAAASNAASLVCQGLVDQAAAADAFRTDWRTSAQVLQQAADRRRAEVAAFIAAEQQRQLDEYLASLPTTTTTAPKRPSIADRLFLRNCANPGETTVELTTGRQVICHLDGDGTARWNYTS